MSKPTHDLLATIGEYTDTKTGEKKKRRVRVGTVFTDDEGRESIKLDSIPTGNTWNGWLSKFPVRERQGASTGDDDNPY